MRRNERFFRWLTGFVLLFALCVGGLGGAILSARAAPELGPHALCPDPRIAQWTFFGPSTAPSAGSGTFDYGTGIVGPSYYSGQTPSEDPAISFTGWDSGSLDLNDYFEFQVDTSGMNSINLSFKSRVSNQGPTNLEVQYSTDGFTFNTFGSVVTLQNNTNWYTLNFDFSSIAALDNNPNVKIRLYGYGAGASGGTWRLDTVTFSGVCPPLPLTVLISEVAWAGTAANTGHEWIELRNPGAVPVDLTGWRIQAADGNPDIPLAGSIPAGGYFLLERDEDAVSDISANLLYDFSNTLSNAGETLYLMDNTTAVIDSANVDGGEWPAGSTAMHASMERIGELPDSDSSWFTNDGVMKNGMDADGNSLWGTPKNLNSLTPTPIPPPTNTPTPAAPLTIVISEVAWMGTQAAYTEDEWIELYNPGSQVVDITGWSLKSSDGSPNITLNGSIPSGGFFLCR